MSIAHVLRKAESMGVTLRLEGDRVKVGGPRAAREAIRPELAAHKPEIVAHLRATANHAEPIPADCVGALRDPDGGLYLPWGARLSPDDVLAKRVELAELIEGLADYEGWSDAQRDDVLARATRGPLYDLLPNLAYFRERVIVAAAEYQASEALADNERRTGADLTNRRC
ncbi:hypothetical protein [Burkholderia pseudomallei]|uniref:hypothetical protein n=1 Tax=Burkholderia pseudomallei TaxID=28450 RepID=UPI0005E5C2A1|nr:hypothetical protein [Burkholderia pseudomallei]CAJ9625238.1 Uncharacterised protein [Burkholderia pseudomallei]CFT61119.1 Uncharacterised protein [Burkholderia pseudomallei]